MRVAIVLTILSVLVAPPVADAPTWREAYDRREFTKAAALLESLVFDRPASEVFPDADAAEHLALMYLQGNGVPADRVLACSLFDLASRAASRSQLAGPSPRLERRREEVCGALSADERQEAGRLMGCVRFGPDLQAFALDSGHWVQISRQGIRVHYRDSDAHHDLAELCGQRFTHPRHVRVPPKAAGGRTRHFLELFSSVFKADFTRTLRLPAWQLLEIVGGSVHYWGEYELPNEPQSMHGTYPPVSFRALATGEVQWRFEVAALSGTVKALPEEVTPDEFPPIQPGTGRIDVTVTDRFGAPMQGVTVALSGLVSPVLRTNSRGAVTFSDLPDGRYDVVASRKGFPGSLPRVLDISGLAVPIEIVLKPSALRRSP